MIGCFCDLDLLFSSFDEFPLPDVGGEDVDGGVDVEEEGGDVRDEPLDVMW